MPVDGQSIVGRLPGAGWLYVAVTHSGVTLAAHLSRLIAAELAAGTARAELAPYRPARADLAPYRPAPAELAPHRPALLLPPPAPSPAAPPH